MAGEARDEGDLRVGEHRLQLPLAAETDDRGVGDLERELVFIARLDISREHIQSVVAGDDRGVRGAADAEFDGRVRRHLDRAVRGERELDEAAERGIVGNHGDGDDALGHQRRDIFVHDDFILTEERSGKEDGQQGEETHRGRGLEG